MAQALGAERAVPKAFHCRRLETPLEVVEGCRGGCVIKELVNTFRMTAAPVLEMGPSFKETP